MDPATVQSDIDRRRMARSAQQRAAQIAGERDRMAEWLATYHRSARDFYNEEGVTLIADVPEDEDDNEEEEFNEDLDDEFDEEYDEEYEDEDFE